MPLECFSCNLCDLCNDWCYACINFQLNFNCDCNCCASKCLSDSNREMWYSIYKKVCLPGLCLAFLAQSSLCSLWSSACCIPMCVSAGVCKGRLIDDWYDALCWFPTIKLFNGVFSKKTYDDAFGEEKNKYYYILSKEWFIKTFCTETVLPISSAEFYRTLNVAFSVDA
jgi:hypothetical protein